MESVVLDVTGIEGTHGYLSDDSIDAVRKAAGELPLNAIHRCGDGNYHYLTLFFLERIKEKYELVLFDNHPDDQACAFSDGMISCGSWRLNARKLDNQKGELWIRDASDLSDEWLESSDLPVYISIDLDVLDPQFIQTVWDQGNMTPDELLIAAERIFKARRVIGIDICGK